MKASWLGALVGSFMVAGCGATDGTPGPIPGLTPDASAGAPDAPASDGAATNPADADPSGDRGTSDTTSFCSPAGKSCLAARCCSGNLCVVDPSNEQPICAAACLTGSDCASGCCVGITGTADRACGPPSFCEGGGGMEPGGGTPPLPTGESGVVVASHSDRWFAVATQWGEQLFEALVGFCFDVIAGDSVLFSESTVACALNEFTNLSSKTTCEVFCSAARPASGVVAGVASDSIQIAVAPFGDLKTFTPGFGCRDVKVGDKILLVKSANSCVGQAMLNLRSGTGCNLRCP